MENFKAPRDKFCLRAIISKITALTAVGAVFRRAVQFVKNPAVLFTFWNFYGIIISGSYLLDKLEFTGANDENLIYDWWHYGCWKNNCVPTSQAGFTE